MLYKKELFCSVSVAWVSPFTLKELFLGPYKRTSKEIYRNRTRNIRDRLPFFVIRGMDKLEDRCWMEHKKNVTWLQKTPRILFRMLFILYVIGNTVSLQFSTIKRLVFLNGDVIPELSLLDIYSLAMCDVSAMLVFSIEFGTLPAFRESFRTRVYGRFKRSDAPDVDPSVRR